MKAMGVLSKPGSFRASSLIIGGLRRREERGHAEKHQGRGGDPAEEVLDPRFHLLAAAASQRDQGVERVAGQLQCDIQGQELDAAHQQHHAQGTGRQQKIELRVPRLLNPVQVRAEADHEEEPHRQQALEDLGEEIDSIGSINQGPFQPDGRQRHRHPEAREEEGRREITPPVGARHGEDEEYDGHREEVNLRPEDQPLHLGNPPMNGITAV